MINIPAGIILIWPGTNASIPAGFSRVTALDGLYPKGANGDTANSTGGAANHTHTSPAHSHNLPAHQHTYTISGIVNWDGYMFVQRPGGGSITDSAHTHSGTTDNEPTGTSSSTAVTYGSVANDPEYIKVIFITGDGSHPIPDNAVMLSADAAIPANYSILAALKNKFLKGAGTGADGGATGGSTTNVHDIGHSHTGYNHNHGPTTSSNANEVWASLPCCNSLGNNHSHTFTPGDDAPAPDNFVGTLTTPETVEPLHKKLLALQASGADLQPGLIGLWLGSIASIPSGWNLCDGSSVTLDMRNFHLKCANDSTEISATAGANSHTHAAQSHTHTTQPHHHSIPNLTHPNCNLESPSSSPIYLGKLGTDMYHPSGNTDDSSVAYDPATTTADVASNEPQYVTVHFIMFNKTYTKQTISLAYKLQLHHIISLPGIYKLRVKRLITVPLSYVMRKINWDLIPKPDL